MIQFDMAIFTHKTANSRSWRTMRYKEMNNALCEAWRRTLLLDPTLGPIPGNPDVFVTFNAGPAGCTMLISFQVDEMYRESMGEALARVTNHLASWNYSVTRYAPFEQKYPIPA
jgi:hypothetical protein